MEKTGRNELKSSLFWKQLFMESFFKFEDFIDSINESKSFFNKGRLINENDC